MSSDSLNRQVIIISDLDGSLLDHHSYSFDPARPMLGQLAECSIPVVLCTSKTELEVLELRQRLKNNSPFIVENGAAIFLPRDQFPVKPNGCEQRGDYWCYSFCPPHSHWLGLLETAKAEFANAYDNFSTMSVEKVASLTGLSLAEAERAKARGYGEPLQWLGSDQQLQEFARWFEARGARVLRGGRFVHLSGLSDKGQALQWLVGQYQQLHPDNHPISIALGDSDNDVAMLEQADFAVVIRSPTHVPPQLQRAKGVFVSNAYGPEGWVEGVKYWLERIDNK